MSSDLKFAIIICSYNPERRSLSRLLNAVAELLATRPDTEVVIVDNNSSPPIAELSSVQDFLQQRPQAKLIVESRQGLCYARIAGVKATSASYLVFFDDDNEPAPDYLEVLSRYVKSHACVGVWGPGQIRVEFLDPVDDLFQTRKPLFQERQRQLEYGRQINMWTSYYPNGTGLFIQRRVMEAYIPEVEKGILQATGRKGASLASAEDIQMVWQGIKLGLAAGMLPELSLKHLIPASKASIKYLGRQRFGIASSYYPALLESFPDEKNKLPALANQRQILRRVARLWLKIRLKPDQALDTHLTLAVFLGHNAGLAQIQNPSRLTFIKNLAANLGYL